MGQLTRHVVRSGLGRCRAVAQALELTSREKHTAQSLPAIEKQHALLAGSDVDNAATCDLSIRVRGDGGARGTTWRWSRESTETVAIGETRRSGKCNVASTSNRLPVLASRFGYGGLSTVYVKGRGTTVVKNGANFLEGGVPCGISHMRMMSNGDSIHGKEPRQHESLIHEPRQHESSVNVIDPLPKRNATEDPVFSTISTHTNSTGDGDGSKKDSDDVWSSVRKPEGYGTPTDGGIRAGDGAVDRKRERVTKGGGEGRRRSTGETVAKESGGKVAGDGSVSESESRKQKEEKQKEKDEDSHGGANEDDVEIKVLKTAMTHVPTLGWTEKALQAGLVEAGLSPAAIGMFPRREAMLVEYFMDQCAEKLREEVEVASRREELARMVLRERIAALVRMRLEMHAPYISTWPQALSIQSHPQNIPSSLKQRSVLIRDLLIAAGEKSFDLTWYAKQAALGAVYTATELYMLTDFSPGFEDTWSFLDRRVEDMLDLNKSYQEAGQVAKAVGAGLGNTLESFLRGRMPGKT